MYAAQLAIKIIAILATRAFMAYLDSPASRAVFVTAGIVP